MLLCVVLNTTAQLALRIGARSHGSRFADDASNLGLWLEVLTSRPVLFGLALWIVSTLLWIYILSQSSLVLAYGLYGLNYVMVPLMAHWRLSEPISGLQVLGMSLIALGVGCTVAGR